MPDTDYGVTYSPKSGARVPLGVEPPEIQFGGMWSPLRRKGCCPNCGEWVAKRPSSAQGKEGRTDSVGGATRIWYLFCPKCGEWFRASFTDRTMM